MHFTLQVQDSLETQERKNMQMKKPIMEAKAFHYFIPTHILQMQKVN